MRTKILVFSLITVTLSVFISSELFAECAPGKNAVTIVNHAGKAIEICVPGDVVENIGGPSDVIIPAICPCFSQEILESAYITSCNDFVSGDWNGITCNALDGYSYSAESCASEFCLFPSVVPFRGGNGCFVNFDTTSTTFEEATACVEILRTFIQ